MRGSQRNKVGDNDPSLSPLFPLWVRMERAEVSRIRKGFPASLFPFSPSPVSPGQGIGASPGRVTRKSCSFFSVRINGFWRTSFFCCPLPLPLTLLRNGQVRKSQAKEAMVSFSPLPLPHFTGKEGDEGLVDSPFFVSMPDGKKDDCA